MQIYVYTVYCHEWMNVCKGTSNFKLSFQLIWSSFLMQYISLYENCYYLEIIILNRMLFPLINNLWHIHRTRIYLKKRVPLTPHPRSCLWNSKQRGCYVCGGLSVHFSGSFKYSTFIVSLFSIWPRQLWRLLPAEFAVHTFLAPNFSSTLPTFPLPTQTPHPAATPNSVPVAAPFAQ